MLKRTLRANARTLPRPGSKEWESLVAFATRDFGPMTEEERTALMPPSNDEWDQMKNPYLVTLRIARRMISLDKQVSIDAYNVLGRKGRQELFDHLEACIDRFRKFGDLAGHAMERLPCAGAKVEMDAKLAEIGSDEEEVAAV
jgi:hypothetical protein